MMITSRENIFHWATSPARVNLGGPVGLNGKLKEMMGCGVSKVTIYQPEPGHGEKKLKKYYQLGHQPGPVQPGLPRGPRWTMMDSGLSAEISLNFQLEFEQISH